MDINILIPPVVGSVIGYTTNWLAIKMLFKPHTAKYIGKFKIPFTPGVIPRERERIAKGLGEAVGQNLLTNEVIQKELLNDEIIEQLKKYIVSKAGTTFVLKDIIEIIGDTEVFKEKVKNYIIQSLYKEVQKEEVNKRLQAQIAKKIPAEKSTKEIMGTKSVDSIHNIVEENKESVVHSIVGALKKEENEEKIIGMINQLLAQKVGGLASMFIKADDVYRMIVEFVAIYLEEEEHQNSIVKIITEITDGIYEIPVGEILGEERYIEITSSVAGHVTHNVQEFILSDVSKEKIDKMLDSIILKECKLKKEQLQKVENLVEEQYRNFVEKNIDTFLEQFDIQNIVETKMNEFSVKEVEDILLHIVSKELRAITWFGALLGFVMGMFAII